MKWYSDLYVGETIAGRHKKIIRKIKHNGRAGNIFLVALPANPANLLDIIPVRFSGHYEDIHVIGLAKGKREACHVAASIIDEVYRRSGDFDIRGYLRSREEQKEQEV